MSFAAAVARLDAEADARLGDFLFYDAGGVPSQEGVQGFIIDPNDGAFLDTQTPIDNLGQRVRLEISRQLVPTPSRSDRVRSDHRLIAGVRHKVVNWIPVKSGRYWLMDLERAQK